MSYEILISDEAEIGQKRHNRLYFRDGEVQL